MLYTRSQAAWHLTCLKLFQTYKPVYFWTFTFKEVMPDWFYPYRWQGFVRDLVWHIYGGNLAGVRVIEPHREHGLHYHALLNKRIWVGLVRQLGRRYGIGRIQVRRQQANLGDGRYLAKYLDKRKFPTATRLARWHTVGPFKAVRVSDVEVLSPLNDDIREAQADAGCRKLPFTEYRRIWLTHFDLIGKDPGTRDLVAHLPIPDPEETDLEKVWPNDGVLHRCKIYDLDPNLKYEARSKPGSVPQTV